MSMRCALMSSRPSSNTANRPMGPAPMIATSVDSTRSFRFLLFSSLFRGRGHGEAIQGLGDLDLTGEPRVGAHFEGKVEHILLHLGGFARRFRPLRGDVDMASRASASASAFGFDAGDGVA